ncbi:MAG: PAS domain-containing protein [Chitinophagaceae bacterium]|nr:PAS domain-containing protein [Chitinophagaceae bacterium]
MNPNNDFYFLAGGGEMGEMMRAKDWSKTSLGTPDTWPESLRTMMAVMLNNPFAMYIAWGHDYTQLYNDAYRPILGTTKHPHALGISTRETFAEIWPTIGPMFDGVMEGQAVGFPDFKLLLNRNGFMEECYFDFSYSPIKKDNGEVGGVLVTVVETTEKRAAALALKESNKRFINNIMQAPVAMCIFRGKNHVVEIANEKMLELWGTTAPAVMNKPIFEGLPEARDQGLEVLLEMVFTSGEKYFANERPVKLPRNGELEMIYINFVYEPLRETDGYISGIVAIATDVTAQVVSRAKAEESEHRVRTLVENAPFPIAVYAGSDMRIELANQSIINIWGKGNQVIGKSFTEILPELENQQVFEQIREVLKTGIAFHTKNTPLTLVVNGVSDTFFFNYSFTPLYDLQGQIYGVVNTGVDLTDLNIATQKIEESEQNLRNLVLQSPIGICVLDGHTLVSEIVNDSFIEIAGKRQEEIAGKYYWDTFAEAKPSYEEALQRVVDEGIPYFANEVEMLLIRHGKKETIYVTFVYAPLKSREGVVKKVIVWVLDNTQQVMARHKVEEADKRFRNTVKQAPVGIAILRGADYVVEMANESYLQLVDRHEEDLVGKQLFDAIPEVRDTVKALLDDVLSTGIPYHGYEVPVPLKRNEQLDIFYFDFLYKPLKEMDGSNSGIIVTATEVTEKVQARKKTEQNEERLNIVVEASELGIWELNAKTHVPRYSQRYLEIIGGYDKEVVLTHQQLLAHLHPDDLHIREKAFKQALSSGYLNYEARVIWQDRSVHWMEGKGKVFYDDHRQPEKLIGTIRDITALKTHQQELEQSEHRFRNLVMQSPIPKAILRGKDLVSEVANFALLKKIWHKDENEVKGKKLLDIFPELSNQKYAALLHAVYTTGIVHAETESLLYVRNDQQPIHYYIDFEYAPLRESDNIISGIKITVIDVTEKVEARKKIEESEKRFRSLTESIPQLIWETDEKGNALFASGKWIEYTGIEPAGEAEWKAIIHPDDYEQNARIWNHSLSTGAAYKCDVRVRGKDGYYRWHSVIGEPVYNKENNIIKWVGAFTDIHTDRAFTHELEKQVAERTQELEQNNIDLAKMNKELQSFAYISSHDLQEPLRKIQTFATQIMEREFERLSDHGKEKFRKMQNSAQRMQTLINDLLTFSRTNIQERKFEMASISSIVDEVKEDLGEILDQKQASIQIQEAGDLNIIPFQFRQLLYNLLSNSLKFSQPGLPPVITIISEIRPANSLPEERLVKDTDYYHITVTDNGIGFDQQYNEKIFEVFQRLHGRSEYSGTGIGLAIVKKIVENHHGFITAKGEVNKGARFDIYIPLM